MLKKLLLVACAGDSGWRWKQGRSLTASRSRRDLDRRRRNQDVSDSPATARCIRSAKVTSPAAVWPRYFVKSFTRVYRFHDRVDAR